ncbi:hypothetical protein Tco_0398231 [Tanacetum coccineum]
MSLALLTQLLQITYRGTSFNRLRNSVSSSIECPRSGAFVYYVLFSFAVIDGVDGLALPSLSIVLLVRLLELRKCGDSRVFVFFLSAWVFYSVGSIISHKTHFVRRMICFELPIMKYSRVLALEIGNLRDRNLLLPVQWSIHLVAIVGVILRTEFDKMND